MNQNLSRENNQDIQISIPLFIPSCIIILLIVIFMNFNTSSSKADDSNKNEVNLLSKTPYLGEINNVEESNIEVDTNPSENIEDSNQTIENITETIDNTDEISSTVNEEEEGTEVETFTYTASDGVEYTAIGILNIPSLGIEYPILSSTSTALLKISLNKYWGPNPHEVGNMVILGHNYNDGKFFSALPKIQIGDIVKITDLRGKTLDYEVYDTYVIDPYDNACTSQLTDGHTEITLITCYSNGTERFVAKARAY